MTLLALPPYSPPVPQWRLQPGSGKTYRVYEHQRPKANLATVEGAQFTLALPDVADSAVLARTTPIYNNPFRLRIQLVPDAKRKALPWGIFANRPQDLNTPKLSPLSMILMQAEAASKKPESPTGYTLDPDATVLAPPNRTRGARNFLSTLDASFRDALMTAISASQPFLKPAKG